MENAFPRPFAFVLMPFAPEFRKTYDRAIKPACRDAGADCERVDDQHFEERILEHIYAQIERADIVIAEMTSQNPNVFYELGYAHARNKRTILVACESDDIPFDLKHHSAILYHGRLGELKKRLTEKVQWMADSFFCPPNLQIGGVLVEDSATIVLDMSQGILDFYIDHVPDQHAKRHVGPFRLELVTSGAFRNEKGRTIALRQPDTRVVHPLRSEDEGDESQNFPGMCRSWPVRLRVNANVRSIVPSVEPFALRVVESRGTREIEFSVELR